MTSEHAAGRGGDRTPLARLIGTLCIAGGVLISAAGGILISTAGGILISTAGGSLAAPAAAQSQETGTAADTADWLTGELDGGLLHFPDTGEGEYDDYGMSLDVLLALQAADRAPEARTAIIDAIADHINEYSSSPDDQNGDSVYAGSTAKAVIAAHAAERDPQDFGGVDLVDRLESTMGKNGKISDDSQFGDFANIIGQAYATEGLAEADSAQAENARDFLLDQQCDSGAFTENFGDDCDEPNLDTTSMVVTALSHADAAGLDGLDDAVDNAAGWLAEQQAENGSFGGDTDLGANSNSSGVAAHALALAGDADAAGKAAEWIAKLQVSDDTGGELEDQVGAIAYNSEALKTATADGISDETLAQWRGATAQGLLGLTHLPGDNDDAESSTGLPAFAWLGIGVLVLIVLGAIAIVLRRRASA